MPLSHAFAWAASKFTSTIFDDIWPAVLFLTGVATMVTTVSKFTSTNLGMSSTMITVLGTIVSLVVSFKTNNSYARWWDGRNIWSNITSNSRQLATLIWLQVPNIVPPKDKKPDSAPSPPAPFEPKDRKGDILSQSASLNTTKTSDGPAEVANGYETNHVANVTKVVDKPQRGSGAPSASPVPSDSSNSSGSCEDDEFDPEDVRGLVEKKTYIGLVQAFSVAMKHALRGEAGPFYTDLYSLIAFLPKYNPSSLPPITREHVLVLWQNGIPRQKSTYADDSVAVPLTQPAAFTGYAFEAAPGTETPVEADVEETPVGLTTTAAKFSKQALDSASPFLALEEEQDGGRMRRHCFTRLDEKHRVIRRSEDKRAERVPITTVELMPPRHPPRARVWDVIPPLRVFKIVADWFKSQKRKALDERAKGGKRKRAGGVRSEIPQEILMYLSAYLADLIRRGQLNTSFIGPFHTSLAALHQSLSDLDKIATTPIPSAYSFHLRFAVWAYLFFLPFQIFPTLGWLTIPATAIASVTYLGFLEIGAQIEMPFAYDQSDLDLDRYVMKIVHQLAEVTAFPTVVPTKQIILSPLNQPFMPSLSLSAPEILADCPSIPRTTKKGFAAAYTADDGEVHNARAASRHDENIKGNEDGKDQDGDAEDTKSTSSSSSRQGPTSIRDLELALNANWRSVFAETEAYIGRPRDQLENRTGMEVAVLTL